MMAILDSYLGPKEDPNDREKLFDRPVLAEIAEPLIVNERRIGERPLHWTKNQVMEFLNKNNYLKSFTYSVGENSVLFEYGDKVPRLSVEYIRGKPPIKYGREIPGMGFRESWEEAYIIREHLIEPIRHNDAERTVRDLRAIKNFEAEPVLKRFYSRKRGLVTETYKDTPTGQTIGLAFIKSGKSPTIWPGDFKL